MIGVPFQSLKLHELANILKIPTVLRRKKLQVNHFFTILTLEQLYLADVHSFSIITMAALKSIFLQLAIHYTFVRDGKQQAYDDNGLELNLDGRTLAR